MPAFNTSDTPIAQDNYRSIATHSRTPRPDAAVVGYRAGDASDWMAQPPDRTQTAIDTLAQRTAQVESATAKPAHHGQLTGLDADDHPQYLLASGDRPATGNIAIVGNLDVEGAASMASARVTGVAPGQPGSVTLTASTQPLQLGDGAKLGAIPGTGGGPPVNPHMAGWLRIYVGETLAAVPYWM